MGSAGVHAMPDGTESATRPPHNASEEVNMRSSGLIVEANGQTCDCAVLCCRAAAQRADIACHLHMHVLSEDYSPSDGTIAGAERP